MLLCLIALLAPPVHFEAERLEVRPDGATADQVRLRHGDLQVQAPRATAQADSACPQGRWQLTGPLRLNTSRLAAQASGAGVCLPDGLPTVHDLTLHTPRGRLAARRARLVGDSVEATDLSATACACDDPPWRVTAQRATWTPDAGVWMRWPVLRLGALPVLAAPVWYAPLARRQSGLIAPRMGFDANDGVWGRLPVFLTLGQSADLTLAPGWRAGPTGWGRLRWAGPDDDGALIVESLERDVRATGRGSLAWGALRLAVEGEATTAAQMRQRAARTLALRGRDHLRGQVAATVVGDAAGLGARWIALRDLNGVGGRSITETWLSWQAPLGAGTLRLDSQFIALDPIKEGGASWLDLVGRADTILWLGPLRLRPLAGAATTVRVDTDAPQTGQAWLGGDADLGVQRRFATLTHRLALRLDGRLGQAVNQRARVLPFDAPLDGHAAGVSLINRLIFDAADAELQARWGYADEPVDPLLIRAHVQSDWLRLDGVWAGDGSHWSTVEYEPVPGWGVRVGHARLRDVVAWPLRQAFGSARPLAVGFDPALKSTTLRGGLFLRPGPLRLRYDLVADAIDGAVLGQWGQAAWDGRCRCWRISLGASHERGRRWPDVMATVQLGAL